MSRQLVEGVTLRLAGAKVDAETLSIGIAGNILILSTSVPSAALTIHSTYHGHEGVDTVIVRLALMPRAPLQDTGWVPRDELPVTHARERCLLDHLAFVQETMQELVGGVISVDVSDASLAATL